MPAGRPTVMTPETVNKLNTAFSMGFTDAEACLFANISKQALYDYCKENPEYTDQKEELKNHPKILAKTNIYNALREGKKVEDSKWYLEKKDKEFGNKSVTVHEGKLEMEHSQNIDNIKEINKLKSKYEEDLRKVLTEKPIE